MHVKKKVLAADIRRSFDNTISLPKSWSAGFSLWRRLNDQVHFRTTSWSLFITAAEVDAARARDQGEWCRTHIRRHRSAPQSFAGHSMRRCKPEASSGISRPLDQNCFKCSDYRMVACTITMIATEMPAAISPYSMAVAPDGSRAKRRTSLRIFGTSFELPWPFSETELKLFRTDESVT